MTQTPRDLRQVEFEWLPRAAEFCENERLSPAAVETAARFPQSISLDPSSRLVEGRCLVERRRRGDITAMVGYPEGVPTIWGAYRNLPMRLQRSVSTAGSGAGNRYPTSLREIKRRLVAQGLIIKTAGSGHERVETKDGRLIYTLPVSPSDVRWIENTIRGLARKGIDIL